MVATTLRAAPNLSGEIQQFKAGTEALSQGATDQAIAQFDQLKQRWPEDPIILNNLAVATYQAGDATQAIELLKQALKANRATATIYQNLNRLYSARARAAYQAAFPEQAATGQREDLVALAKWQPKSASQIPPQHQPDPVLEQNSAALPIEQILVNVQAWAQAWSNQDIDAYLSAYVTNYRPQSGLTHELWRAQRQERLQSPEYIRVSIDDFKLLWHAGSEAMVSFLQGYRSNRLDDRVMKILVLRTQDGQWKIQNEQTLP